MNPLLGHLGAIAIVLTHCLPGLGWRRKPVHLRGAPGLLSSAQHPNLQGSEAWWLVIGALIWNVMAILTFFGVFGKVQGLGAGRWGAGGALGVAGLALFFWAVLEMRRRRISRGAKVNIWSVGRPGEMLVGVVRTGLSKVDPAGMIVNLDCLESDSDLTRRLWTAEIHAPAPTGPDTWPFHFSIPEEAPPSGLSPNGVVRWRLRARTASRSEFGASFDLGVARVQGPPSRVLPVPPPTLLSRSGGTRRFLRVSEEAGGVVVRLGSRTSFPGPNPIVLWALGVVAALWVLVMTVASVGAYIFLGLANGAVALGLLYAWFAGVELHVTSGEVVVRRVLFKFADSRRFARAELTGLRVNLTGAEPVYGVWMERGDLRPVGVFEGFSNLLDAHEAARTLSRILGRPVI